MNLAKLCEMIYDCDAVLSYNIKNSVYIGNFTENKKLLENEIYSEGTVWLPGNLAYEVFKHFTCGKTNNDYIWYVTKWYTSVVSILSVYDYSLYNLERPPKTLYVRRSPVMDTNVVIGCSKGNSGLLYIKQSRFVIDEKLVLEVNIEPKKMIKKLINQK